MLGSRPGLPGLRGSRLQWLPIGFVHRVDPPPQSRHRGRSAAWTWRKTCSAFWPSPRRDGWSIVAFDSPLVVSAPLAESNTCSWFDIDMKMTIWGLTRSTSGIKWLSIHRCLTTCLGGVFRLVGHSTMFVKARSLQSFRPAARTRAFHLRLRPSGHTTLASHSNMRSAFSLAAYRSRRSRWRGHFASEYWPGFTAT